ncbi:MAG TPA: MetQ/NlpA family ABC transporter substrate-binding protein [Anaerolineales bacterium]|nr:MetQ/NlpA family ABC transporter substrate-binding protein [Anaerolineales bacterium]
MNKKNFEVASFIFLALLFFTSCESQKEPIRIAISAWAGVEPAELAAQLGYYEKYGVNVEMVRFSAYSDSLEALRDGNVDAGMHTLDDSLRNMASGRDIRVVLLTDYSYGGDGLVARAGIESLSGLKGSKIGVEIGTVGHLSVLKILEQAGINISEVTLMSIPAWEIQQAMINNQIDAGVTWEPYLTSTAEMINGKVLITSKEYPETIITTMTFDATVAENRKEDVQKIVAAYFDAVEYIKQHPQESYMIMGQAEGVSAEEFASHVEGIKYIDLSANMDLFSADSNGRIYAITDQIGQFLAENNVINYVPDVHKLLDAKFVQNVFSGK